MMTFCKKSVHYFLGSSNTNDNGTVHPPSFLHHHHQNTTSDSQKPPDVIEKTPHFSNPFGTSTTTLATGTKRDPGGIGFMDDVGGSVDGLMSCTESLGFESSDERRVDHQIENLDVIEEMCSRREPMAGSRWKREHVKREVKQFPPPLSSLNRDGKPTFFLRPLRKDGKLELQEVKIGRPEILRASRQDGRLRLHLIKNEDEDFEEENEQEEEGEEEEEEVEVEERAVQEEENMQEIQENVQEMEEGQIGEEEEEVEEKVEERVEGWQIPASPGRAGEGFLRCHEQVCHHQNHHHHHHGHHGHHHDLAVWRQHCVTIR